MNSVRLDVPDSSPRWPGLERVARRIPVKATVRHVVNKPLQMQPERVERGDGLVSQIWSSRARVPGDEHRAAWICLDHVNVAAPSNPRETAGGKPAFVFGEPGEYPGKHRGANLCPDRKSRRILAPGVPAGLALRELMEIPQSNFRQRTILDCSILKPPAWLNLSNLSPPLRPA